MNFIKRAIKKIVEYHTGEPENLIIIIDPTRVQHPERYFTKIVTRFEIVGRFTVAEVDQLLVTLGSTDKREATDHFNIDPARSKDYGWFDISQIRGWQRPDGKYVIRFCVPYLLD